MAQSVKVLRNMRANEYGGSLAEHDVIGMPNGTKEETKKINLWIARGWVEETKDKPFRKERQGKT
ncbi:MAG: hypothetical protein IIB82_17140 [Bacteroidetes bacterium]|nr:hypothetical protein [Bacteroidota bacterium]